MIYPFKKKQMSLEEERPTTLEELERNKYNRIRKEIDKDRANSYAGLNADFISNGVKAMLGKND